MNKTELNKWFTRNILSLEKNYLLHSNPRKQSGFSGSLYKWTKCRKPIADCVDVNGTFLDAGCANGYLLQSIVKWKNAEGINIVPYGLDSGTKLIEMAKYRLPDYSENFFTGNILNWDPPFKFNYVRTELVYVPEEFRKKLIQRLLEDFIKPKGKLLLCEYRSSGSKPAPWINLLVNKFGFKIHEIKSGFFKGKELSRIVVILKKFQL